MRRFGLAEHDGCVFDTGDEVAYLVAREPSRGGGVAQVGFGLDALGEAGLCRDDFAVSPFPLNRPRF